MKPHYNQGHLNIKNHFLARDPSQDPTQMSTVFTTQGNIITLRLGWRSGWGHWSAHRRDLVQHLIGPVFFLVVALKHSYFLKDSGSRPEATR